MIVILITLLFVSIHYMLWPTALTVFSPSHFLFILFSDTHAVLLSATRFTMQCDRQWQPVFNGRQPSRPRHHFEKGCHHWQCDYGKSMLLTVWEAEFNGEIPNNW